MNNHLKDKIPVSVQLFMHISLATEAWTSVDVSLLRTYLKCVDN